MDIAIRKKRPALGDAVHRFVAAQTKTLCGLGTEGKHWRIDRGAASTQPVITCRRCLAKMNPEPDEPEPEEPSPQ